jgi:tRNA/tmRNA/rRNA uracil-C5-methylase (TrmA/RlmC/RlmD family)
MPSLLVDVGLLPLADLPYDEQLARREELVRDALRRGHVATEIGTIVPSPRTTGARARVKLRVGPGGALGFNRPGTHTFVEVPLDELARPEVVEAAAALRGQLRNGEVEVRSDGEKVAIVLDVPPPGPIEGNVFAKGKVLSGHPRLRVLGLSVSPASFYQVNLEINERIVADVDAALQELAPTHLLDLYAGVGNLSARAIARGVPATLVEQDRSSAADAAYNLPTAEILTQDAGKWVPGRRFFDVALLDPPRAGAQGLLQKLVVTRPRAILYLSCDPVTLARDLRTVAGKGYSVARVQPYDMFPGTDHVESLAVLLRS